MGLATCHTHRVFVGQQILWLHVAMEITLLVRISESLEDLVAPVAHPGLGEVLVPVLGELVQVALLEGKKSDCQDSRIVQSSSSAPPHADLMQTRTSTSAHATLSAPGIQTRRKVRHSHG